MFTSLVLDSFFLFFFLKKGRDQKNRFVPNWDGSKYDLQEELTDTKMCDKDAIITVSEVFVKHIS